MELYVLIAVLMIPIWLIFGGMGYTIAEKRGGNPGVGFALGILLGPLGVVIALFIGSPDGRAARAVDQGKKKRCPECAEAVQPEARRCRYCGYRWDDTPATDGV